MAAIDLRWTLVAGLVSPMTLPPDGQSDSEPIRPLGPNHALLCGIVIGVLAAHRAPAEAGQFDVEPEIDGADFTGRTLITRPTGTWAVVVVPVEVSEL